MPKNRPRCHCGGDTKRNGTTSKGTTRWRCKACGASVNKRRPDVAKAATFTQFIEHCTTTTSLEALADRNGVSVSTMKRRFSWCWLVDVPDPTIGHTGRIYDQVFLDGTYTASGCLIVAATLDHVIAWHWCKRETTRAYKTAIRAHPSTFNRRHRRRARSCQCHQTVLAYHTRPTLPGACSTRGTPLQGLAPGK